MWRGAFMGVLPPCCCCRGYVIPSSAWKQHWVRDGEGGGDEGEMSRLERVFMDMGGTGAANWEKYLAVSG